MRADQTAAYQAVGDIQSQSLGRIEDARRSYLKAIELGERLLAEPKAPPATPKALAAAYMGMFEVDLRHGDPRLAIECGQKSLAVAESAGPQSGWS